MNGAKVVSFENYRSLERIKSMGEVFTPEQYVQQMLEMLDVRSWADESTVFFEPSCGQGNIVLPILAKRIALLANKYRARNDEKPRICAVANALNTLWAIDICSDNVELTRKRVFELALNILSEEKVKWHQPKTKQFVAHLLCALIWQIHENDALSALADEGKAYIQANKTKLGRNWIKTNKHKPITFEMGWCDFFTLSQKDAVTPVIYQRALKFVDACLAPQKPRGFEEFAFARDTLQNAVNPFEYLQQKTKGVA